MALREIAEGEADDLIAEVEALKEELEHTADEAKRSRIRFADETAAAARACRGEPRQAAGADRRTFAGPAANMVAANQPPAAARANDESQMDGACIVFSRTHFFVMREA